MIDRRSLLMSAAALAFGAIPAAGAIEPDAAKTFINSLANDAIQLMARKDLPGPERTQRFRELFNRGFDVTAIGRFALGRYWRDATNAELAEYLRLFEDLIVTTYAGRFNEYSGETLTVLEGRPEEDRFLLVMSQINRGGGNPPIRIDWRIADSQGNPKIVDVVVEGVSMSVTQRSEFASVIQRNGGKVQGLIVALRAKTKSLQTR